jgi:CxxC motif-containing protein (DUF1111 family)
VDSSIASLLANAGRLDRAGSAKLGPHLQAAAADGPNADDDGAADPEMTGQELFDLVSFAMLLAAPELEAPTERTSRGRLLFHDASCSACHTPRLNGPRGPIPVYSDLLLHDMGEDLADGIIMNDATGSEFRTQPLWGLAATGPYLHDGRAKTIKEAVLAHGGEAQASRDASAEFADEQGADLVEFLLSLGGRSQATDGLLAPDSPMAAVGEYGGPFRELTPEEQERYLRGRAVYDRDFGFVDGAGGLAGSDGVGRFNGDSCRACHFDPVLGGAGPRGVNVMRHGIEDAEGTFDDPSESPNTILHKQIRLGHALVRASDDVNVFEHRQTPHTFGMGLIDAITADTILANADPDDEDGDGISGRPHTLADGRLGRFGWKAQVPTIAEFVGDAMAAEIGLTLPVETELTFAIFEDSDGVADPELSMQDTQDIIFFLRTTGGPPRQLPESDSETALVDQGEVLFDAIGCAKCHIPSLAGELGVVPLYSDLLLHEILPAGSTGIVDGDAGQLEFRTAPLWGVSQTAPYFHSGEADTVDDAIRLHDGEATAIRVAYVRLGESDREAVLAFLDTL